MAGEPANGPPAVFVCPIGKALMTDPVLASDGVNYERAAIEVPSCVASARASLSCRCV